MSWLSVQARSQSASRARRGEAPSLEEHFQLLVVNRRGLAQIRTDIDIFILALGFVDQFKGIAGNIFVGHQAYPLSLGRSRAMAENKASQLHFENAPNLTYGPDSKCTSIWDDSRTRHLQAIANNTSFEIPKDASRRSTHANLFAESFVSDDSLRHGLDMKIRSAQDGNQALEAISNNLQEYIPEFTNKDFKWGAQLLVSFTLYHLKGAENAEELLKNAIRAKHQSMRLKEAELNG
ncbi:hypothetical protein BDP81DRAFT_393935 [Colletotrichum phormii]|uniref:Uncharacterized protein n=1 Tax=Colletotrichum phormii TaxID=359342 RepID=A0AAI9ZSF5_9PEZI|nr:uncharacterized protein BDP81DRAFT_393935 [Colletotrichum phormii]KAK1637258.1 hypothetical protein BDP81DRAFT_393935 [Colletotrichum phormii]